MSAQVLSIATICFPTFFTPFFSLVTFEFTFDVKVPPILIIDVDFLLYSQLQRIYHEVGYPPTLQYTIKRVLGKIHVHSSARGLANNPLNIQEVTMDLSDEHDEGSLLFDPELEFANWNDEMALVSINDPTSQPLAPL